MIENFLNSCRRHREMLRFSVFGDIYYLGCLAAA